MTKANNHNDTVRARLLDAAVALFAERGYAATSIREIVEAAGVTKPALYYYFRSKEGIFRAIFDEAERTAVELVDGSLRARGSSRERIERMFCDMRALFEREKTAVRFLNGAMWGPRLGVPPCDFRRIHSTFLRELERLVAEGIASGELRAVRPDDVARTLLAVLSHHFDLTLAFPSLAPGKAGLKRDLELVFQGIRRGPTGVGRKPPEPQAARVVASRRGGPGGAQRSRLTQSHPETES